VICILRMGGLVKAEDWWLGTQAKPQASRQSGEGSTSFTKKARNKNPSPVAAKGEAPESSKSGNGKVRG